MTVYGVWFSCVHACVLWARLLVRARISIEAGLCEIGPGRDHRGAEEEEEGGGGG